MTVRWPRVDSLKKGILIKVAKSRKQQINLLFHEGENSGMGSPQRIDFSSDKALSENNDTAPPARCDTVPVRIRICKEIFVLRYKLEKGLSYGDQKYFYTDTRGRRNESSILRIRGSIQYDYLYRSYLDVPFAQRDFQQHSIQGSLNITVKDKYPVKLSFSTQQNNSAYFKNLFNINMQFDRYAYLQSEKQHLLKNLERIHFQEPSLNMAEEVLRTEVEKYNNLKLRLARPDFLQQLVEEKEKIYNRQLPPNHASSLNPSVSAPISLQKLPSDSLTLETETTKLNHYNADVAQMRKSLDSLQQRIMIVQHKRDSLKALAQKSWSSIQQTVYKARNVHQLQDIAVENGIPREETTGLQRVFSRLKSVGLGRSVVNYSELTAWNIGLTGMNMEYNTNKYAAFAVGKIDYGFREFFGRNTTTPDQNFLMGRFGFGDKENKAIIFSVFTGKKYNYGHFAPDSITRPVHVMGYSLEAILRKDEHTALNLEIAKTTRPVTGNFGTNGELKSLTNFKDLSNVGLNVKAQTLIQPSGTKVSGYFRKTGQSFQSFSLYTYNTDQAAWQIKMEQPFLKERINLTGMLRKNDFASPFTDKTFQTSTIFKTLQLSIRVPKYPVVSLGYYPGTQLYIINKELIRENVYYIFNGSVAHSYMAGGIRMASTINLNHYANKGTDSGFIAYAGTNYLASHTMVFNLLQLQAGYMYTSQEQMNYTTLDGNIDYAFRKSVRVGAGVKHNKIQNGEAYWGGRVFLSADMKSLGRLQLQYEKSYMPTIQKTLFPIEIGRITWFKNF